MVLSLLKVAAPDLQPQQPRQPQQQQQQPWNCQDVQHMLQALPALLQQSGVQHVANSIQLQQLSLDLVYQLAGQQLQLPARQQELAGLCHTLMPQMLRHVERIIAAEYQYRTSDPQERASSGQLKHSQRVGSVKVEVLGALYALQLQTGRCSWEEIERCIAQPAQSLTNFLRVGGQQPHHKRFVLFLAAQVVDAAPSLLQWTVAASVAAAGTSRPFTAAQQQQQQQRGSTYQQAAANNRSSTGAIYPAWQQPPQQQQNQSGAAAAGPAPAQHMPDAAGAAAPSDPGEVRAASSIPAVALLRLWLRWMLDAHPKAAFAKCMTHVTCVLERAPATSALFRPCGADGWREHPQLLQDGLVLDFQPVLAGSSRGLLVGRVMSEVVATQGARKLGEILCGLHQVR